MLNQLTLLTSAGTVISTILASLTGLMLIVYLYLTGSRNMEAYGTAGVCLMGGVVLLAWGNWADPMQMLIALLLAACALVTIVLSPARSISSRKVQA